MALAQRIDNDQEGLIYLGIDPGCSGGYALVDAKGHVYEVGDIPTTKDNRGTMLDIWEWDSFLSDLKRFNKVVACVEDIWVMRGDGLRTAALFIRVTAQIETCIVSKGIELQKVLPKKWKAAHMITEKGRKEQKEMALCQAKRQFPHLVDQFKGPRKYDRAEAALIGIYCQRLKNNA